MKSKTVIGIALCLCLGMCLALSVYAHSGSTDGDGGHYDRSTGEYHWHHGESAHQHEDIDGDGDLDCPYDFRDTTESSSGSSSGGGSTYSRPPASPTPYRTPLPRNTPTPTVSPTKPPVEASAESIDNINESRPPMWIIYTLSAIVVVLSVWLYAKTKKHKEDIDYYENRIKLLVEKHDTNYKNLVTKHNEEVRAREQSSIAEKNFIKEEAEYNYNKLKRTLEAEVSEIVKKLHALIDSAKNTLGSRYLSILSGAPDGHFIGEDSLPTTGKDGYLRWGKTYTFFANDITSNTARYHSCNCIHKGYQINAYTIHCTKSKYIPCKVCNPKIPQLAWVNTYRTNMSLIQEIKDIAKISEQALSEDELHPSLLRVSELQKFAIHLGVSYNTAYNIMIREYEGNTEKPSGRPQ